MYIAALKKSSDLYEYFQLLPLASEVPILNAPITVAKTIKGISAFCDIYILPSSSPAPYFGSIAHSSS
mgnify:CR=1 FL=1